MLCIGQSTVRKLSKDGDFPRGLKLGSATVGVCLIFALGSIAWLLAGKASRINLFWQRYLLDVVYQTPIPLPVWNLK